MADPRPASRSAKRSTTEWIGLAALSLPWLVAPWPLGTDLPQHAAQSHRLGRALEGDAALRIAWLAPDALVHAPLFLSIEAFGPVMGTRLLSWLLVAASALAMLRLCRLRQTPIGLGLCAMVLLWNANLYRGDLAFQAGFLLFLGWLTTMLSAGPDSPRRLLRLAGLALILLGVHSLWFAAAGIAGLALLSARPDLWRVRGRRLLTVLPALGLAYGWIPRVRARGEAAGFDLAAHWVSGIGERFGSASFLHAALGDVRGGYLPVVLAVLVLALFAVSQCAQRDGWKAPSARVRIDVELCLVAVLLLLAVAALPDELANTSDFARRWVPYACILLVLGRVSLLVPPLGLSRRWPASLRGAALLPLVVAATWTAVVWYRVGEDELSGLEISLTAIGEIEAPRTLGLDFIGSSAHLTGEPYRQQFAWAQALHGGTLSFSIAERHHGIVDEPDAAPRPWTRGLEREPERLAESDLAWFDVALVGGDEERHALFAEDPRFGPMTLTGVWRAYRIRAASEPDS